MRDIWILTRVFLKERRQNKVSNNKIRDITTSIVLFVAAFVLLTVAFFFAFKMSIMMQILTMSTTLLYEPQIMVVIYVVLFFILLVTTTLSLTKHLYYADDNKTLLTLPVKGNYIFIAKLLASFIQGIKRAAILFIPPFIAYGMVCGVGSAYYIAVIIGVFLTMLLITVVAALLSIPTLYMVAFLKRNQSVQMAAFIIFLGLVVWSVFALIMSIPTPLNIVSNFTKYFHSIQSFLKFFQDFFVPWYYLTLMLVGVTEFGMTNGGLTAAIHIDFSGTTFATMGVVIAVIALCGVLIWFATKPIFFRMASKQFETNRKIDMTPKQNPVRKGFLSQIHTEILGYIREPRKFFSATIYLFVMPFAILLLSRIFGAINLSEGGREFAVRVEVLLMILFMLSSNNHAASVLSAEGDAYIMLKTRPAKMRSIIYEKLFAPFILSVVSLVISTIILGGYTQIFFVILSVHIAHILWSVDMDILNPQQKYYVNGLHQTINPNEVVSIVWAFILAFAVFGLTFLFYHVGVDGLSVALTKIMLVSFGFLALRVILHLVRVNAFLHYDEGVVR